jgi:hypothetical protein
MKAASLARFEEGPVKGGRVSASRRSISTVSRWVAAWRKPGVRSPVATLSNSTITDDLYLIHGAMPVRHMG